MPGRNVRFYGSGFRPRMAFGEMHHLNMRVRQQQQSPININK